MSNTHFLPWRQRGIALSNVIDHQILTMEAEEANVSRKATLISLLTALKAFGASQLEFFLAGFDPTMRAIRLEPSTTYPPEYAMRATIDQIAYDLDVIQRAYQQRLPSQSQPMRDLLDKADYLAYQALKPAIDRKLIGDVTVVTYFQKAVNVRIIPYAPVAFIGLPLSALAVPSDLLAIPHEVGHYVFRHGCTQHGPAAGSRFDAAFREQLRDLPKWCLAWLEEIFADVYGAVVGGPVMALGFEDLVTDDPYEEFTKDDGEHPIAALRPNIYHYVLEKLGSHGRELQLLQERWKEWQRTRGNPKEFTPHKSDTPIALADAEADVKRVISLMWEDELSAIKADTDLWSGNLHGGNEIETLHELFAEKLEQLSVAGKQLAPELDVTSQSLTRGIDGTSEEVQFLSLRPLSTATGTGPQPAHDPSGAGEQRRRVGETGLWFDAVKHSGSPFNVPPAVWMALLDGSGWAIEGPSGGHAH